MHFQLIWYTVIRAAILKSFTYAIVLSSVFSLVFYDLRENGIDPHSHRVRNLKTKQKLWKFIPRFFIDKNWLRFGDPSTKNTIFLCKSKTFFSVLTWLEFEFCIIEFRLLHELVVLYPGLTVLKFDKLSSALRPIFHLILLHASVSLELGLLYHSISPFRVFVFLEPCFHWKWHHTAYVYWAYWPTIGLIPRQSWYSGSTSVNGCTTVQ